MHARHTHGDPDAAVVAVFEGQYPAAAGGVPAGAQRDVVRI